MTSIVTTLTETRKFGPESEMDFLRHFDWYALETTDESNGLTKYIAILPALGFAADSSQSLEHAVSLVKLTWEYYLKKLETRPEGLFLGINSPIKSLKKCGEGVCLEIDYQLSDRFLSFFSDKRVILISDFNG